MGGRCDGGFGVKTNVLIHLTHLINFMIDCLVIGVLGSVWELFFVICNRLVF